MKRVLILFTLLIVVSHGCTERGSALAILDTIDRTTLTTQKSRAHHALLNAMALDKNFVDVYQIRTLLMYIDIINIDVYPDLPGEWM